MPSYPDSTKLLLHNDAYAATGSQDFVDSSPIGRAITAVANAYQFSHPLTDGTGYFDLEGTNDYFTALDSPAWALGSAWSIDFWARLNTLGTQEEFIGQSVDSNNYWRLIASGSNNFNFVIRLSSTYTVDISGAHGLAAKELAWYAASYDGTTYRLFVNGSEVVSSVDADQIGDYASTLRIGYCLGNSLDGQMTEMRVSNSDRGWTGSTIAVPTAQHTSDANTLLLLHANEVNGSTVPIDSSSNARAITNVGSAVVRTFGKFGRGGAEIEGSANYLTIPNSSDWFFNTNPLGIGIWTRFNSVSGDQCFVSQHDLSTFSNVVQYNGASNTIEVFTYDRNLAQYDMRFTFPFTPIVGTLYHIEIDRDGDTWYAFVNGVAQTKTLTAGSYSAAWGDSDGALEIGRYAASNYFNAMFDELIIVNGEYLNNANFTPNTEAYSVPPTNRTALLTDIALRYTPTPVITSIAPESTEINNAEVIVVTGQSLQYTTEVIWGLTTLGAFNTAFSSAFNAAEYIGPSLPFTLIDENTINVDVSGLFIGSYPLVITSLGSKYESPENLTITRQPYTPTLTDIVLSFTPMPFLSTFVPISADIDAEAVVLITGGRINLLTNITWAGYSLAYSIVDSEHVSVIMAGLPIGSNPFVAIIDGSGYETPTNFEIYQAKYGKAPTISQMLRYGKFTGRTSGEIKFPERI